MKIAIVAAGMLAAFAAAEALAPAPDVAMPSTPAWIAAPSQAGVTAAGDTGTWQATILARPLLRPDRKPLSDTPVVAAAALPRLSAIVLTATGGSAIFDGDNGKPLIVAAGGVVDGYKIQSIGADRVELSGPSGRTILRPQFASPAATASAVIGSPNIVPPSRLTLENE